MNLVELFRQLNPQQQVGLEELLEQGYDPEEAFDIISNGVTGPGVTSIPQNAEVPAGAGGKVATWFNSHFGKGKSLFGGKSAEGSGGLGALKEVPKKIRETSIVSKGPTIGTVANIGMGAYEGSKAIKGIINNTNTDDQLDSLKSDINQLVASNPMYSQYLNANDEKLLREMQSGTLNSNQASNTLEGVAKGIPQAALSAGMGLLTGGPVGAAIGGLGSLFNAGISGYGKGTKNNQIKLQGLYDKLKQADEEYRTMKRPIGLRQAGLQSRYYNQLY